MKPNRNSSAGTKDATGTNVDDTSVRQTIAKPNVGGSFDFTQVSNGTVIRRFNDNHRDWVCIHKSTLSQDELLSNCVGFGNKNVKDNTGFALVGGMWYLDRTNNNPLSFGAYGKTAGELKRGMAKNIRIVGHIGIKEDFEKYLEYERL